MINIIICSLLNDIADLIHEGWTWLKDFRREALGWAGKVVVGDDFSFIDWVCRALGIDQSNYIYTSYLAFFDGEITLLELVFTNWLAALVGLVFAVIMWFIFMVSPIRLINPFYYLIRGLRYEYLRKHGKMDDKLDKAKEDYQYRIDDYRRHGGI